ncbi:MAG TPA: chromate transporter [Candidatus Limiplasma sp.]|nr:chromate transporter [Candidatus Limiplasma sp.]
MIYLQLAFEFFKAGLFAVGGGLATLPFLMQTSVAYPQWFSIDELMQMVAVSESTPGPIGINMASFVGFHVAGIPGAIVATLSLTLPAFVTILLVVNVLDRFKTNRLINGGLEALRPAVTGLIAAAGFVVLKSVLIAELDGVVTFQWLPFILFIALFGSLRIKQLSRLHPIVYIAIGAVLGIAFQL